MFWVIVAGLTPLAGLFSSYELGVLGHPLHYEMLIGVMLLLAGALWKFNQIRAKSSALHYEDIEPEVITRLKIGPIT